MSTSLGLFRVVNSYWSGRHALTIELESNFTDRYFQVYAGRSLVGLTTAPGQTRVVAQVDPTECPTPITVVMVSTEDRETDVGELLPKRPWNSFVLRWSAESFPADTKWFDVVGSPAAGEPIDDSNPYAREQFVTDGEYSFDLPAVNECGAWTYGVISRDDALPFGNPGPSAELSIEARPYPPDVATGDDDVRLVAAIADGELTVSFDYE